MIEKNNRFLKDHSFENRFFSSLETYIHPTAVVGKNVKLGLNVKIGPFCVVIGNVTIDDDTRIHSHVSIGFPAQDLQTKQSIGAIEIGKNCQIREFVTISSPKLSNSRTSIGNHCYVMNFSHIAHDVTLEDHVTLINNVNLAGHVYIEHHAMLMANTGLHQFCRVGAYSALAPFSGMRQDLPPFSMFNGLPGRFAGLNLVALKRAGCNRQDLDALKTVTKLFFQDKLPLEEIEERVSQEKLLQENKYVNKFISFVKTSNRGISRKTIKDGK